MPEIRSRIDMHLPVLRDVSDEPHIGIPQDECGRIFADVQLPRALFLAVIDEST